MTSPTAEEPWYTDPLYNQAELLMMSETNPCLWRHLKMWYITLSARYCVESTLPSCRSNPWRTFEV